MDDKYTKIDDKLTAINDKLGSIDTTLVKQHEQLAHHIYRTEQNETMIKVLVEELKPVKSHVSLMNNLAKIIIFLGVLAAIFKNLS